MELDEIVAFADAALPLFAQAVETAGVPAWPVTKAEVIGEDEGYYDDVDEGTVS